jgi:hypothetical protein
MAERNIFLRPWVRTDENKSMRQKNVSTTNVFVPVSQLSTRDLFYFLKIALKIRQDTSYVLDLDHF